MIPTGGNPREIDIEPDGNGSVLKSLQLRSMATSTRSTWSSETVSAFTSTMTTFLRSRRTGPFTPIGDVLEPDNMNKDGLADLGEEL